MTTDETGEPNGHPRLLEVGSITEALVEGSRDAVFLSDRHSRFVAVNAAACELTGYSREELLAMSIPDLHDEVDLEAYRTIHERILAGEDALTRADLRRKDGRKLPVELASRALTTAGVVHRHTTARDLSERLGVEAELRASETRYRELVENLNDVVYAVALDGKITYVSPAVEALLGHRPADIIRRSFGELVHPDDLTRIRVAFAEVLEGRLAAREYRMRHRDGSYRWVRTSSRPLEQGGVVVGLQGVLSDVSARRREEDARLESERGFRTALENVALVAVLLDHRGRVSFINDFTLALTGWELDEVLGGDWFGRFLPADVQDEVREVFLRSVEGGTVPAHYENPIVTRSGERRLIRWSNTVLRDSDGRITHAVSLGEDVTERVAATEALRRSERLLAQSQSIARIGGWQYEVDTGMFWWTDEVFRIYGVTPGDRGFVIDRAVSFYPGEAAATIRDAFERSVEVGEGWDLDLPFRDAEGRPKWVRTVGVPELEADRVTRVVGTIADITEAVAARRALERSEARYRSLFASVAEGFAVHEIVTDADGRPVDYRFLDANPAFFEITGLDDRIIGRSVLEVLPETESFWITTYGEVALTGTPRHFEHYTAALGKWFEVRVYSPAPGTFATLFADVTDRRRAEEERTRLLAEVRGLTARLAASQEAERKRLARELHDRVGQSLTSLGLTLDLVRSTLPAEAEALVARRMDAAAELVSQTMTQVRDVMAELRPPMLDEYGLMPTFAWWAERLRERTGLDVHVEGQEPEPRLGTDAEVALFRIVQEALANVAAHSGADAATVSLTPTPGLATLEVADSGRGFTTVEPARAGGRRSWGLAIMRERATAIGAELTVTSRPGAGTRITVAVPR